MRAKSLSRGRLFLVAVSFALAGCTHPLNVKNLEIYQTQLHLTPRISKPKVAILPFSGTQDALWFFNAIVGRLNMDPAIGAVYTDYIAHRGRKPFDPDIILSIQPNVTYRSSGWNFLINWPGFLIFTPSWNGYIYRADIMTTFVIHDPEGNQLDMVEIPVSYNIRHAAMNRTIFTGLTWLEVSALAFFGGLYNANVFDRNVIAPLRVQIKDNYTNYVLSNAQGRIRAVADSLLPPVKPVAGPQSEAGDEDVARPAEEER